MPPHTPGTRQIAISGVFQLFFFVRAVPRPRLRQQEPVLHRVHGARPDSDHRVLYRGGPDGGRVHQRAQAGPAGPQSGGRRDDDRDHDRPSGQPVFGAGRPDDARLHLHAGRLRHPVPRQPGNGHLHHAAPGHVRHVLRYVGHSARRPTLADCVALVALVGLQDSWCRVCATKRRAPST